MEPVKWKCVVNVCSCLSPQDLENENNLPLEQVSIDDILEMQREEQLQKQQEEEKKKKALMERGLQPNDHSVMDEFF